MQLSPLSQVIPSYGAPTLEDFDTTDVQVGQRLKGSRRQFVRFYKKKFLEIRATDVKINEKTGEVRVLKTVAEEVEREMVEIITPGDKNSIDAVAQNFHRRDHWHEYKAFRDGKVGPIGTSLDECDWVAPAIATELRYLGCHTLEQLADCSDVLCNNIPSGWELREYARAMCKANQENKSLGQVNVLKAELEKNQSVIAQMQEQISKMQSMILNSRGVPFEAPSEVPEGPKPLTRTRKAKEPKVN